MYVYELVVERARVHEIEQYVWEREIELLIYQNMIRYAIVISFDDYISLQHTLPSIAISYLGHRF